MEITKIRLAALIGFSSLVTLLGVVLVTNLFSRNNRVELITSQEPNSEVSIETSESMINSDVPELGIQEEESEIVDKKSDDIYVPNSVYYGKLGRETVIFYDTYGAKIISEIGSGHGLEIPPKFSDLENPTLIYSGTEKSSLYPINFVLSDDHSKMYVTMSYASDKADNYPNYFEIIEIDVDSGAKKILFHKNSFTNDGILYKGGGSTPVMEFKINSSIHIERIEDNKYLVLRAPECYACDEIGPGQVMIFNTENARYIKIEAEVGDLKFDLINKKLTYRELEYNNSRCEGVVTEYCFGSYEPTGQEGSVTLP